MRNDGNRQVVLAARPDGIPQAEHFALAEAPKPEPAEGQFLVRNLYLSVDPAMRGWVSTVANYSEPVAIGAPMRSTAIAEVEESRHPDYAPGDILCGMYGWQDYALGDGSEVWFRHDASLGPATTSLGVLGINGLTAYFGLLDVGAPKVGETVVVSTAAGGVGSAVGQIARLKGCRTVGLTGSDDKVVLCRETYGYDVALNYRTDDLDAALAESGVDVYFDNTAGAISDTVYRHLNERARCIVCGTVSLASWQPWPEGPRVERHLLVKRARIEGFLLFDYKDRFAEARRQLAAWIKEGKLAYREEILDGLDKAPDAIARLYRGENRGKLLIRP